MDEWKRDFDQWLWDSYVNVDKTTSQTVTEDYVKKLLDYLQNDRYPDEMDRQQRHNFKHKVFIYLLGISYVWLLLKNKKLLYLNPVCFIYLFISNSFN